MMNLSLVNNDDSLWFDSSGNRTRAYVLVEDVTLGWRRLPLNKFLATPKQFPQQNHDTFKSSQIFPKTKTFFYTF